MGGAWVMLMRGVTGVHCISPCCDVKCTLTTGSMFALSFFPHSVLLWFICSIEHQDITQDIQNLDQVYGQNTPSLEKHLTMSLLIYR